MPAVLVRNRARCARRGRRRAEGRPRGDGRGGPRKDLPHQHSAVLLVPLPGPARLASRQRGVDVDPHRRHLRGAPEGRGGEPVRPELGQQRRLRRGRGRTCPLRRTPAGQIRPRRELSQERVAHRVFRLSRQRYRLCGSRPGPPELAHPAASHRGCGQGQDPRRNACAAVRRRHPRPGGRVDFRVRRPRHHPDAGRRGARAQVDPRQRQAGRHPDRSLARPRAALPARAHPPEPVALGGAAGNDARRGKLAARRCRRPGCRRIMRLRLPRIRCDRYAPVS